MLRLEVTPAQQQCFNEQSTLTHKEAFIPADHVKCPYCIACLPLVPTCLQQLHRVLRYQAECMLTISWCGIRVGTVRSCALRVRLCWCLAVITTLTLAALLHRDKLPLHVARIYLYSTREVITHSS